MRGRWRASSARSSRVAIEKALGRFVDLIEDPASDDRRGRATYVDLGRGEMRAGRSLDALLSAYRLGSRLAWRRFVEAGVAGGLDPGAIYALGEGIFAYIDEISAESAEGYAEEQSAAAGERQRLRRRLVRLLAQDPPASEESVLAAAAAASWPLPRSVAALVTGDEEEPGDGRGRRARRPARPPHRRGGDRGRDRAAGARARARRRRARAHAPPDGRRRRAARRRSGPAVPLALAGHVGAPRHRDPRPARRRPPRRPRVRARRGAPAGARDRRRPGARRRARRAAPRAARRRSPRARARGSPRRCAPGSTAPARCRRSRPSSASIPRPCATASSSCASCSATGSRTPRRASSSGWRCGRARLAADAPSRHGGSGHAGP